jgi:hypothetical protein
MREFDGMGTNLQREGVPFAVELIEDFVGNGVAALAGIFPRGTSFSVSPAKAGIQRL